MTISIGHKKNGHRDKFGDCDAMTVQNNELTPYQEESVNHQPTRNPNIPSIFTRAMDAESGEPTGIYWGPLSENEVIQTYILDPGHGEPLRVEYMIAAQFPDVAYMDAANIADEIYQHIAQYNAETIFGAGTEAVAA